MPKILLLEDDSQVAQLLRIALEQKGHTVCWTASGEEALQHLAGADLLALDLGLPDVDGVEFLSRVREIRPRLPVLVLTAKDDESTKVYCLEIGADDYMTKPFSVLEFTARVQALLRRAYGAPKIRVGPLVLDGEGHRATLDGKPLKLSRTEFALLRTLASAPGRVWSRSELLEEVWGADFDGTDRVVDVYINMLRKKLGDDPRNPHFIETMVGVGYRLLDLKRENPTVF
ncbi:response regulator transcription factor [Oceanithermus sp.]